MPNVTEIKRAIPFKFSCAPDRTLRQRKPLYALWGGIAGFIFYLPTFAVPILQFGANATIFAGWFWSPSASYGMIIASCRGYMEKLTLLLLVLLGCLQYSLWLGKNGVHDLVRIENGVVAQQSNNAQLKARNAQLFAELMI